MIKVSVIIPVFNMGIYLEKCLRSVLAQTLTEVEVICINDGSTDHSIEILQAYASSNENMIVVNQSSYGVSRSRNKALEMAKGEYVAFMDADDFYPETDILEVLYSNAKSNSVVICGGSFSCYRKGNVVKEFDDWRKKYTFTENGKISYRDYQFHYGFTRFIYNLEFLRENSLYFPEYERYEDPPFFVKAMVIAKEFYALSKVTYCYREGHKRTILSPSKTIDYAKGVLEVLKMSRNYKLNYLHTLTVKLMYDDLIVAIYKHIVNGNNELQKLVFKLNEVIDLQLLGNNKEYLLLEPKEIQEFIEKMKENEEKFLNKLRAYKGIVIFGAGMVGRLVSDYLKGKSEIKIFCFAISEGSSPAIDGIQVKTIDKLLDYKESALILIATLPDFHEEISHSLKSLQYKNILPIDFKEFQFYID